MDISVALDELQEHFWDDWYPFTRSPSALPLLGVHSCFHEYALCAKPASSELPDRLALPLFLLEDGGSGGG